MSLHGCIEADNIGKTVENKMMRNEYNILIITAFLLYKNKNVDHYTIWRKDILVNACWVTNILFHFGCLSISLIKLTDKTYGGL